MTSTTPTKVAKPASVVSPLSPIMTQIQRAGALLGWGQRDPEPISHRRSASSESLSPVNTSELTIPAEEDFSPDGDGETFLSDPPTPTTMPARDSDPGSAIVENLSSNPLLESSDTLEQEALFENITVTQTTPSEHRTPNLSTPDMATESTLIKDLSSASLLEGPIITEQVSIDGRTGPSTSDLTSSALLTSDETTIQDKIIETLSDPLLEAPMIANEQSRPENAELLSSQVTSTTSESQETASQEPDYEYTSPDSEVKSTITHELNAQLKDASVQPSIPVYSSTALTSQDIDTTEESPSHPTSPLVGALSEDQTPFEGAGVVGSDWSILPVAENQELVLQDTSLEDLPAALNNDLLPDPEFPDSLSQDLNVEESSGLDNLTSTEEEIQEFIPGTASIEDISSDPRTQQQSPTKGNILTPPIGSPGAIVLAAEVVPTQVPEADSIPVVPAFTSEWNNTEDVFLSNSQVDITDLASDLDSVPVLNGTDNLSMDRESEVGSIDGDSDLEEEIDVAVTCGFVHKDDIESSEPYASDLEKEDGLSVSDASDQDEIVSREACSSIDASHPEAVEATEITSIPPPSPEMTSMDLLPKAIGSPISSAHLSPSETAAETDDLRHTHDSFSDEDHSDLNLSRPHSEVADIDAMSNCTASEESSEYPGEEEAGNSEEPDTFEPSSRRETAEDVSMLSINEKAIDESFYSPDSVTDVDIESTLKLDTSASELPTHTYVPSADATERTPAPLNPRGEDDNMQSISVSPKKTTSQELSEFRTPEQNRDDSSELDSEDETDGLSNISASHSNFHGSRPVSEGPFQEISHTDMKTPALVAAKSMAAPPFQLSNIAELPAKSAPRLVQKTPTCGPKTPPCVAANSEAFTLNVRTESPLAVPAPLESESTHVKSENSPKSVDLESLPGIPLLVGPKTSTPGDRLETPCIQRGIQTSLLPPVQLYSSKPKTATRGMRMAPKTPPTTTAAEQKASSSGSSTLTNITLSPIKPIIAPPPAQAKCHYTTLLYICDHKFTHPGYARITHVAPCALSIRSPPHPHFCNPSIPKKSNMKCTNRTAKSLELKTEERCPRCEKAVREEEDRAMEMEMEKGMQGLVESVEGFKRQCEEEKGKIMGKGYAEDKEEDWEDDEIEGMLRGPIRRKREKEEDAEAQVEKEDEWMFVERIPFGKKKAD